MQVGRTSTYKKYLVTSFFISTFKSHQEFFSDGFLINLATSIESHLSPLIFCTCFLIPHLHTEKAIRKSNGFIHKKQVY